jgi:hypothetical protein
MSYSGQSVTIPLGQFGLLTDRPPSDIPPNALIKANNITLEKGFVEKAAGTLKYNSSALSAGVVGLFDWHPDSTKQRMIAATSDGKIFRDIGDRTFTGGVAIASGLGALTPNCFFVEAGHETALRDKKLFFFTQGLNQLKVLAADGITFADIETPAVDWVVTRYPTVGIVHRNRLWAFQGQRSYASATDDHEEFQTGFLTDNIFPGEGGDIRGVYVFKGRLFAFKDSGFVYYLVDSNSDSSAWYWSKLASNFGLSGPHAIVDALDDMLGGNTTGTLTSYNATNSLGDIETADRFAALEVEEYLRSTLSTSGLTEQHLIYYAFKKQLFMTYRTTYKPHNDAMLCFDMNKQPARLSVLPKGTPQCLALRKDMNQIERPMYGDNAGFVMLMDYEDRSEGGTSYKGEFQTPFLDFRQLDQSLALKQKHFDFLSIEFKEAGNHNVSVDVFIDERFVETITFTQQIIGDYLDQFDLNTLSGTNPQADYLGTNASQTLTKRLHGTGRRISFVFSNSGANESFQIASYTVGLRGSGEQATKT